MINHILRRLCAARDIHPVNISRPTMEILLNFDYPGNIRELENILEHALIISQEKEILPQHLPDYIQRPVQAFKKNEQQKSEYADNLYRRERHRIEQALTRNNGNRNRTAQALGIDRTTLWRKMKRYGLLP